MRITFNLRPIHLALLLIAILLVVGGVMIYKDQTRIEPTTNMTGVRGVISKTTGNCLPSTNAENTSCKKEYLSVELYVYEPITRSEGTLEKRGVFRANPGIEPIARARSNLKGFFEIELPPGNYSIFYDMNGQPGCGPNFNFAYSTIACLVEVPSDGVVDYYIQDTSGATF
jgi:hypothetical protein